jgi:hypothetical protein
MHRSDVFVKEVDKVLYIIIDIIITDINIYYININITYIYLTTFSTSQAIEIGMVGQQSIMNQK